MRPQQQGRRRNNNRGGNNNNRNRNQNPLQRSYESNGPDVKIRGNPQIIADKYNQLARDASSAGDTVMAENYFQHAEHYTRIIMAAQPTQQQRDENDQNDNDQDDNAQDDNADNENNDAQANAGDQDNRNNRNRGRNNRNRGRDRDNDQSTNDQNAPDNNADVAARTDQEKQPAEKTETAAENANAPAEPVAIAQEATEAAPVKKPRAPRKPRAPKAPKAEASGDTPAAEPASADTGKEPKHEAAE